MKKFIMLFLLVLSTSVFAKDSFVDTTGLNAQQQAEIAKQVAQLKENKNPVTVSENIRNETIAWTNLGANMGKAMVGAAKEVGVAANEFSQTNLGKITVAIVTYKVIGKDILSAVIGFLILVFGFTACTWIITTRRWSRVKYEYVPILWGAFSKRRVIECDTDDEVVLGKLFGGGLCLVLTLLVGLETIF